MIVGVDIVYNGPAGSMLSFIIHSLLLLPVKFVRPLLHELLSLLPHLDKLNSVLPAATLLETEELTWSVRDGTYATVFIYQLTLSVLSWIVWVHLDSELLSTLVCTIAAFV